MMLCWNYRICIHCSQLSTCWPFFQIFAWFRFILYIILVFYFSSLVKFYFLLWLWVVPVVSFTDHWYSPALPLQDVKIRTHKCILFHYLRNYLFNESMGILVCILSKWNLLVSYTSVLVWWTEIVSLWLKFSTFICRE